MKNKWNLLCEDYCELFDETCWFYRRHWLAIVIYTIICVTLMLVSVTDVITGIVDWFDGILRKVKAKFKRTK